MGHLVRPMRMRPLHPLPPLFSSISFDGTQKKKRRVRAPLVRARRQRIDPTKYGPVHVSGVLLDTPTIVVPSSSRPLKTVQRPPTLGLGQIRKADDKPNEVTESELEVEIVATPKSEEIEKTFVAERARNLALLSGLFGDKDVWEGREDSGGVEGGVSESGEYEESDDIALGLSRQGQEIMPENVADTVSPSSPPSISSGNSPEKSAPSPEQQTEVKRLKDLFAPAVEPGT